MTGGPEHRSGPPSSRGPSRGSGPREVTLELESHFQGRADRPQWGGQVDARQRAQRILMPPTPGPCARRTGDHTVEPTVGRDTASPVRSSTAMPFAGCPCARTSRSPRSGGRLGAHGSARPSCWRCCACRPTARRPQRRWPTETNGRRGACARHRSALRADGRARGGDVGSRGAGLSRRSCGPFGTSTAPECCSSITTWR